MPGCRKKTREFISSGKFAGTVVVACEDIHNLACFLAGYFVIKYI